jgi:signal transduction histidine kinase
MSAARRLLVPASWRRLPPRTARLRLTLIYAGLFLLLGTAMIGITYLLESRGATVRVTTRAPRVVAPSGAHAAPGTSLVFPSGSGSVVAYAGRGSQSQFREVAVNQLNADLGRLLAISWVVLALTTLGAAVLGWFAAGRLLAPLRSMTATARTISAGSLDQRLAVAGPNDEFKQLGDTLDDLFGRLEASFTAQRRFVANASHELRTPLTVERTLLQVALTDPNATEASLRGTCEELLVSQVEHARLLESLLTLATSERGLDRREALDLSALAGDALREFRPEIARRELRLFADLDRAPIAGDPALLARLIANLIDNAIDHNVAGGLLEIRTSGSGGRALLSVTNTGPPIPAAETGRLFEPFERLNVRGAETNGHHGLGLSIVQSIATAHGALVVARPRPGGGLTVEVEFGDAREPADLAQTPDRPAPA